MMDSANVNFCETNLRFSLIESKFLGGPKFSKRRLASSAFSVSVMKVDMVFTTDSRDEPGLSLHSCCQILHQLPKFNEDGSIARLWSDCRRKFS